MNTTLNLRFDKDTIQTAKQYAHKHNTCLSSIVEAYLKRLIASDDKRVFISDNLVGILKQYEGYSDDELKEMYLKEKHDA